MASASGIRSYVDFQADFPEEEETTAADVEIPLGRPIAEHLRARLETEKFVVCEVYQHSFYGWAFEVRFGSVVVWCMLQGSEAWLLITEVPGRWIDRLLRRAPDEKHRTVVNVLGEVLAQPGRHSGTPRLEDESLRTFLDGLHVLSREFTGVGSFTKFQLDPALARVDLGEQQFGLDELVSVPGVPRGYPMGWARFSSVAVDIRRCSRPSPTEITATAPSRDFRSGRTSRDRHRDGSARPHLAGTRIRARSDDACAALCTATSGSALRATRRSAVRLARRGDRHRDAR